MEDFYKILGVEKSASSEEIKKAYRNLAFKFHPDRNLNDKTAEEQFKKVNEAYSVLGDEAKRRQYDMNGTYANQFNEKYQNGFRDPFDEFFGNGSQGQNRRNYRYTYTYTPHQTESNRKGFSLVGFFLSIFQIIFCFFGFVTVGRFSLLFGLLFFAGLVSGIRSVARNLRFIITE